MWNKPLIVRSPQVLWVLPGTVVTIVSLIILPFLVVFSHFVIVEIILQRGSVGYVPISNTYINIYTHTPVNNSVVYALKFLNIFQYIAFILILCIYPPYPAPFSLKSYFKGRGFKRAVYEYELVKKVLYAAVPLLIISTVIGISHDLDYPPSVYVRIKLTNGHYSVINQAPQSKSPLPDPFHQISAIVHPHVDTFNYMKILLVLIVTAGILKMVFAVARKDFRLYFAMGCFRIIQEKRDEVEKMKYFVMGLNSYNSYLRRNIKLQINDLKKIYSQISSSATKVKNETVDKICRIFIDDRLEDYTLEPVRYLYNLLNMPETPLLTEQPITNKLKEYGAAVAIILPLAIQIVSPFLHHT